MTDPASQGAGELRRTQGPLADDHDGLLVDLDGVVQLDDQAVTGAPEVLARLTARGHRVAFVTNNAARSADEVAERLGALGVPATPAQIVTSAMATAALLAGELPGGAPVFVVGGAGLRAAVSAVGLRVVDTADDRPAAVVQGWGPEVCWADLAEASIALRAGARWLVTNRDRTLPSPRGPLPGSGSLVAALVAATGREPDTVVGKPEPGLFTAAAESISAGRPLVVGDRLDTDIAGADRAGMPVLLVLTGVSTPADVLAAVPGERPTYLGADLGALEHAHPGVAVQGTVARCRDVAVTGDGGVQGDPRSGDGCDGLRAAASLAWRGLLPAERYAVTLAGLDVR